jgi:hypothetical protein
MNDIELESTTLITPGVESYQPASAGIELPVAGLKYGSSAVPEP